MRAYILDVSFDGSERRHGGGHEEGARALSLSADEIAVGRGCAIFSGGHRVAVHRDAHGTAGFPPLASRGKEDFVEAFRFRAGLDLLRTRDDVCGDAFCDVAAFHDASGDAEVLDARIRTASEKHVVNGLALYFLSGL